MLDKPLEWGAMVVERPGLFRWLYYAYGGGLGKRYAQWVLHDLTSRGWLVRHVLRTLVQCLPAFLLLLLPADAGTLFLMMVIVFFGALFMSVSYAHESRRHRLYKHGFIPELVLDRSDD
jgi:hypothetical protein